MSSRWRIILIVALVVIAGGIGGWYWWQHRRVELYGGVRPYMKKLRSLYDATAAELAKSPKLPEDFEAMEQLSQDAQDIFAVFKNDPREMDPKFGPLCIEQVRQANKLEHDWDNSTREQAVKTFVAFTNACNTCHEQMAKDVKPLKSLADQSPMTK